MTRERPSKDIEKNRQLDTLDEMERRISETRGDDFRPKSIMVSALDWSDKEEGYYYRWFSGSATAASGDTPQTALTLGYEFVRHKHGVDKGEKVIQNKVVNLYLMRIKQEYKDIMLRDAAAEINRKERGFKEIGEREFGEVKQKVEGASPYPLMED